MKKLYRKFISIYFSPELDFRARLFTVLALSGVLISFLTCIQSLLTFMWSTAVVSSIMMLLSALLTHYARVTGNYRKCYHITITVIFLIFFPVLFFTSGGYLSGMPAVFIFAVIFSMMMLEGRQAIFMMMLELFVYSAICWLCYVRPELVVQFSSEKAILIDILFAYSAVSIACGVTVFLHLKEYNIQREMLREKNIALKQMDEAKSAFLTTVAHEVKNPLNIISLHAQDTAELLEEETLDFNQIRENQKIIQDTVMRMDRVLTDLMDTVSIEQGRLRLSPAPMQLSDVIRAAAQSWEKQYASGMLKTGIELHLDENICPLMADYSRIYQVLSNLLINAFRHTPKGTVKITLKQLACEQLVCVEDNGEGMDEEIRKKALEGYISGDKNYWRHGIGLYVCHRVIQAHGGRIWIESEKGKGTKVYFALPLKENVP